jgi:predicted secreted protein
MADVVLGRADDGTTVAVAAGDSVVFRLDEIPTSGYRWEVTEYDPAVLLPAADDFVPASADAVGGGGHHEFRFKVVGPGTGKLRLIKRRAWESESTAVDSLEVTIHARDAADSGPLH